jgi:hypothetical protein
VEFGSPGFEQYVDTVKISVLSRSLTNLCNSDYSRVLWVKRFFFLVLQLRSMKPFVRGFQASMGGYGRVLMPGDPWGLVSCEAISRCVLDLRLQVVLVAAAVS